MHINGYLGASSQKSDPVIRSGDLDGYTSTIGWSLWHIFEVNHV